MLFDWHEATVAAIGVVVGLLLHKYVYPDRDRADWRRSVDAQRDVVVRRRHEERLRLRDAEEEEDGMRRIVIVTVDGATYDYAGIWDTLVTLRGRHFRTEPEHRAAALEALNQENQQAALGSWYLDPENYVVHRVAIPADHFGSGWVFRYMVREVRALCAAFAAIPHTHC